MLELQEELINTQNEIVLKTKQKQDFGMGSIDLVLQEQKTLSVLEEEKNNLKDKKDNVINVLKNYLSINDDKINRIKFDDIVLIHDMPESLDSKTIESRPDYLANLEFLKKIGYDVKAARRELLPSFTVFGALGFNAYDISNIFKNSTQLANIGIVPNLDIFDGGYKYAYLKLQKYKYDEALNNFRKVVVEDLNELNLALNQNKTSKENYLELTNQKQIEDNIYDISLTKENIGTLSNLDTLYEKENKLLVDRKNVENTINYIISTISLYKASDGKNILDKENL